MICRWRKIGDSKPITRSKALKVAALALVAIVNRP